jgi:hypothetical protein
MRFRIITLATASVLGLLAGSLKADIITFEGAAPTGGVLNVSPATPYKEDGFTFTPSNSSSAVFDAGDLSKFPGDTTSWFGFADGNLITMTGPAPFNLNSLLIGPSTIGIGTINETITADVFGGGTLSATFSGLTTATLETLNWKNLTDVKFSVTSDAGMDNLSVSAGSIPEPGSLLLLGTVCAVLALRHRLIVSGHSLFKRQG